MKKEHRVPFVFTAVPQSPANKYTNQLNTIKLQIRNLQMRRAQLVGNAAKANINRRIKNLHNRAKRILKQGVSAVSAHYAALHHKLNLNEALSRGHVVNRRGRGT